MAYSATLRTYFGLVVKEHRTNYKAIATNYPSEEMIVRTSTVTMEVMRF